MDYPGWIVAVTTLLEYQVVDATTVDPTGTAFDNVIPNAIDYTENRIQRDLNLLMTEVTSPGTGIMTPNSRLITLPSVDLPTVSEIPALIGQPIPANSVLTTTLNSMNVNVYWPGYNVTTGQQVSLVNPLRVGGLVLGGVYTVTAEIDANNFAIIGIANATATASRTVVGNGIYIVCSQIKPIINGIKQTPLEPVTRDFLEYAWPSDASVGANIPPVQWCPNNQTSILVGPAPDQAYGFEVLGTMRIPQLSAINYVNALTTFFPDLYLACSMVFWAAYQANYGAQSDNPQQATSWEAQYQTLLKSAVTEETRKRFMDMYPSPSSPVGLTAQG